eukprot:COSAG01_NODE_62517_length_284_cov_0.832432_1_plen_51_part_10
MQLDALQAVAARKQQQQQQQEQQRRRQQHTVTELELAEGERACTAEEAAEE